MPIEYCFHSSFYISSLLTVCRFALPSNWLVNELHGSLFHLCLYSLTVHIFVEFCIIFIKVNCILLDFDNIWVLFINLFLSQEMISWFIYNLLWCNFFGFWITLSCKKNSVFSCHFLLVFICFSSFLIWSLSVSHSCGVIFHCRL